MIIWGSSTTEIGTKKINGTCAVCHTANLTLTAFQRVFHLYWIPTIPLEKNTYIVCGYCTTTYPVEAYSGDLHAKTISFKTPWWTFFGLGLAVVLIIAAIYSSISDHKDSQAFKSTPQAGIYFTFAIIDDAYKKTPYSFGKIEEVKDDEIIVRFSKYAYSDKGMAVKSAQNSKDKSEDSLDSDIITLTQEKFKAINLVNPVY